MNGYRYPELEQFVELVEGLYRVRVGVVEFNSKNKLLLYTDSPYKDLDILKFHLTKKDEKTDLQEHIERLKNNPYEAITYAKICMLNHFVTKNPELENTQKYIDLLDLASNKTILLKYFEKTIKGKLEYKPPSIIIKQKVFEPTYLVKRVDEKKVVGEDLIEINKKFMPGDFIEIIETKEVPIFSHVFNVDPVGFGLSLMEISKIEQQRVEEEAKRKSEEEKTNLYIS